MLNMKFSSAQDVPGIAGRGKPWGCGSHTNPAGLEAVIRRGQDQFKQILAGGILDPGQASGARR